MAALVLRAIKESGHRKHGACHGIEVISATDDVEGCPGGSMSLYIEKAAVFAIERERDRCI